MLYRILLIILLAASVAATAHASDAAGAGDNKADDNKYDCMITLGMPLDCVVYSMGEFYHDRYGPYKSIEDRISCNVGIEIMRTCEDVLEALENGTVDVVGSRISCFLRAKESFGAVPVLGVSVNGEKTHHGVMLVRKDSPYEVVQDLRNGRFSTIESDSVIYRVFPEYLVRKTAGMGMKSFFGEIMKCISVPSAIHAVIMDQADAVVVDEEFLKLDFVSENLRMIEESFEIPYPVVFLRPDADEEKFRLVDSIGEELRKIAVEQRMGSAFKVTSSMEKIEDPDFLEFTAQMDELGLLGKIIEKK